MRVVVVYESMFGNTQKIAQAVAEGLAPHAQVDLVEVGDRVERQAPEQLGSAIP